MFNIYLLVVSMLVSLGCNSAPGNIELINNGSSKYSIVLPAEATATEKKAASVLQNYLLQISGVKLNIVNDENYKGVAIYIGKTSSYKKNEIQKIQDDGFLIASDNQNVFICGNHGRSTLYGVYTFLEDYLGCKKYSNVPAVVPKTTVINIPANISNLQEPSFIYRQAYYPANNEQEFLDWHKQQKFEDLWGLWGHSFHKLIPAKENFAAHPEYFALVNGKRQASQLCLSNPEVLKKTIDFLKQKMSDNPDAIYWSVSQNDDNEYCTCDACKKIDEEEGGPQGSLIRFVNSVAKAFPDKIVTTLAYAYTSKAPKKTKPAPNVYIMLSSIDAYREKPLNNEPSAAGFRNNLKAWEGLTHNLFIWDYTTQFTNYLAPFPQQYCLGSNAQYLKNANVKGIFAQGSGDTYSDMAELNAYLQSKLLWNANADVNKLTEEFCNGYYGPAGKFVLMYLQQIQQALQASGKHLDIYGNPINDYNSYLKPDQIDQYSTLLDKAEVAVSEQAGYLQRVQALRLSLEYTVLQQSKFYGIEKFGYLVLNDAGGYTIKNNWPGKVERFVQTCKKNNVTELSEDGIGPDEYGAEWKTIFSKGYVQNLALQSSVTLAHPFAEDYPAKKEQTLVDGAIGYKDFSYNWLCFYGSDLVATIDMHNEKSIKTVFMNFLNDPRHWIFQPQEVSVEVSQDGVHYTFFGKQTFPSTEEDYKISINKTAFTGNVKARFIKVTAKNLSSLPAWRFKANKKPMICCDEVYVQ
ncbi:DUF4838 domain-containing protein [Chitinophagaceae bacterium LWZ2-11]